MRLRINLINNILEKEKAIMHLHQLSFELRSTDYLDHNNLSNASIQQKIIIFHQISIFTNLFLQELIITLSI